MLEKTIKVRDKEVKFRSSASIPRLYRVKFHRDLFKDMAKLEKVMKRNWDDGKDYEIEDLEIFENVAYIMASHADPSIPKTVDEWLDGFEMFSIFEILPQLMELWGVKQSEISTKQTLGTFVKKDSEYPYRMEADWKVMNAMLNQEVVKIVETEADNGTIFKYIFDLEAFAKAPKVDQELD